MHGPQLALPCRGGQTEIQEAGPGDRQRCAPVRKRACSHGLRHFARRFARQLGGRHGGVAVGELQGADRRRGDRSVPALRLDQIVEQLGLVGVVPMLLTFNQPFGFNAILGLIGLAGILMRNTLILPGQDKLADMIAGTIQKPRCSHSSRRTSAVIVFVGAFMR